MSAPVMSMFANELDCLRARDKYHTDRIAELEERANYNGEQWVKSAEAIIEQSKKIDRLTAHIRAVANYHDGLKYSLLDGVRSPAWELHHTERRDFALSGLEEK